MIKLILSGADGVMGQIVAEAAKADERFEVIAGLDRTTHTGDFPVYENPQDVPKAITEAADCIIDFSHFSAFPTVFPYAADNKLPIVIATTGLDDKAVRVIEEGSAEIPVFRSANMSLGINILITALQKVAGALEPGFDIEIIEKHHNRKVDAPSGTALLLADSVNEVLSEPKTYHCGRSGRDCKRTQNEIGISAVRGGTIAGEHTVLFAGEDELIEFKHTALSRKIFANGALDAAAWLIHQPAGLYNMQDLIG